MAKELKLQRLVFLDENVLNPFCPVCNKELSGFLITEKELLSNFSDVDLGWLLQNKLIKQSRKYNPKLVIFLCRHCCKGEKNDKN